MFGGVFPLTKTSLTLACLPSLLLFALFTSASRSCLNLNILAPKNNRRVCTVYANWDCTSSPLQTRQARQPFRCFD